MSVSDAFYRIFAIVCLILWSLLCMITLGAMIFVFLRYFLG